MSKSYLLYIPLSLVCIASFQYRVYEGVQFHGDESTWLANARAFWLVLSGDFDNPYWQGYDGWTQPHAGHYVYAIVLRACGYGPEMLHQRYASSMGVNWNYLHGRVPSRDLLLTGRRFSALCGALACLVVCEIGRRTFGWTAGIVAACWLAANPLMRHVCQRAMIDGQLTLGLAVGVLLMIALLGYWQARSTRAVLAASAGVGLFFGFVASLKMNGGVLCVIAIGALAGYAVGLFLQKRRGALPDGSVRKAMLRASGSVLLVCALAAATFYALNPQMWATGPVKGFRRMTSLRLADVSGAQKSYSRGGLTTARQRMVAAMEVYFIEWPTLRRGVLEDFRNPYDVYLAADRRRGLWQIEGPLFVFGVVYLVATMIRRTRQNRLTDPACIVVLWLAFYSAFAFVGIPLRWPRYYQKYLLLQGLMFGIGVAALIELVRRFRRGRAGAQVDRLDGPGD